MLGSFESQDCSFVSNVSDGIKDGGGGRRVEQVIAKDFLLVSRPVSFLSPAPFKCDLLTATPFFFLFSSFRLCVS